MLHKNVSAFVLAGGKSSRMGTNKAFLSLNGSTPVEQARALVAQVCEKVFILGARELYSHLGECLEDVYPDCGPLGGIHVALLNSPTPHSLIIAVDTPFITAGFLDYMIERALSSSAMVTSPRIGGVVQPTCAVFTHDFLAIAEAALQAGQYKIEPLFPQDKTLLLEEADINRFALGAQMFDNLNTPEDFERARKRR